MILGSGDIGLIIAQRMSLERAEEHPEIELCYCVEGSFTYRIDKPNYTLQKNDLAVIGSMICHEVPFHEEFQLLTLTIEVSPILLMELFEPFSKALFRHPVFSLEEYDP